MWIMAFAETGMAVHSRVNGITLDREVSIITADGLILDLLQGML